MARFTTIARGIACAAAFAAIFNVVPAHAQPVLLDLPTQVAVDAQGNVYVLEPGQRRVARFDAAGTLLGRFGAPGSGPGQFSSVTDITVDPAGNVLVLDRTAKAVSVFGRAGNFISRWAVFAPSSTVRPNALAATATHVFVSADDGGLYAYSPAGQFLAGRPVITGQQGMDTPGDLATDGAGNLYAIDRANNRVLRFGTGGPANDPLSWRGWIGGCSAGTLCQPAPSGTPPSRTTGWCMDFAGCGDPRVGSQQGRFTAPVYLSAAPDGSINVSDIGGGGGVGGIQRFNPAGAYLGELAPRGRDLGQVGTDPTAVAANGDVLAVQTRVGRVSRFSSTGQFRGVFGGGVELSVFPGDTAMNPLNFIVPGTQTTTVSVVSLGGYAGPLTLASTRCIGPRGVPAVACSSLGITTAFANPTVTAGPAAAATPLAITVTPATPDGLTLVIVDNATGSIPAFAQVGINVALQRGISVTPAPASVTLMPGDPPARVNVAVASTNVTGTSRLSGSFTPVPSAGHLSHDFQSGSFTVPLNGTVNRTLDITALEKARTGVYTLKVKANGPGSLAPESPVDVTVDCGCRTTGDFVLPSVRPVTVTSGLSGTSPNGNFVVTAASTGPSASVSVAAQSAPNATLVGPVANASSWGFSPNSRYFVVTSAGPASHITQLDVFDLNFQNRRVLSDQIVGCPVGDPTCAPPPPFCQNCPPAGSGGNTTPSLKTGLATWGFGPNSRSFVLVDVNPLVSATQYNLALYNLTTTPMATRIVSTSGPSISAFWRYSPCGDLLMHFHQMFAMPSSNDEARFYKTYATTAGQALAETAHLIIGVNGTVAAGPVGARVDPAFVSTGDFDVRLLNLSRSSGSPATGFQSLQCRR